MGYFSKLHLLSVFCCAFMGGAEAQSPGPGGLAQQAAGLFMHSCVVYAGNSSKLRQFLDGSHVPLMKPEAAKFFVTPEFPGLVYNASNTFGHLAVVSHDNGACTVFSNNADGDQAVAFVEQFMKESNITLVAIKDYLDPRSSSLRHRSYNANFGERKWLIVLSTSSSTRKFRVEFTASPGA